MFGDSVKDVIKNYVFGLKIKSKKSFKKRERKHHKHMKDGLFLFVFLVKFSQQQ